MNTIICSLVLVILLAIAVLRMRSIVKKFGVASPNDTLIVQQMISLCIFVAVYSVCAYFSYRYIKATELARDVPSDSPGYNTAAIDVE